jgi:hypothetical protein
MAARTAAAAILLAGALAGAGCGAGRGPEGIARPWPTPGVGSPSGDDPIASPDNRVQPHQDLTIPALSLSAIYIGEEDVDGVANRDDFLAWVVASNGYWSRLSQYGIGFGTFVGSTRIASESFFTADELRAGFVSEDQLGQDIFNYAYAAPDVENAMIFFMPTSMGITATAGGAQASCTAFGGYHNYMTFSNGSPALPFAVIPPCVNFPPDMPTSHELVEMVTNPVFGGWYEPQTGEEIGDLCNFPVSQPINLWTPTRFWSNADGACVPQ